MNYIKKIITVVIIIFCYSFSQAQQYQITDSQKVSMQRRALVQHKLALKKATYIFEGTVMNQECYNNKKGEIWTCTIFQITKIFKGNPQIILGSIKVVTFQSGGSQKVIDGGPSLSKIGTYIIIGNPADKSMLNDKMTATDNTITIGTGLGVITIIDDVYNQGKLVVQSHAEWEGGRGYPGDSYKTIDDLYAFLKENGITVQEEVAQPQQSTSPADSTKQK